MKKIIIFMLFLVLMFFVFYPTEDVQRNTNSFTNFNTTMSGQPGSKELEEVLYPFTEKGMSDYVSLMETANDENDEGVLTLDLKTGTTKDLPFIEMPGSEKDGMTVISSDDTIIRVDAPSNNVGCFTVTGLKPGVAYVQLTDAQQAVTKVKCVVK